MSDVQGNVLCVLQSALEKAVNAVKEQEGILLGQFVAVLNAKKEEIARLRRDVESVKEKLQAERERARQRTDGKEVEDDEDGVRAPSTDRRVGSKSKRRPPSPESDKPESDVETDPGSGSDDGEDRARDTDSLPPTTGKVTIMLPLLIVYEVWCYLCV